MYKIWTWKIKHIYPISLSLILLNTTKLFQVNNMKFMLYSSKYKHIESYPAHILSCSFNCKCNRKKTKQPYLYVNRCIQSQPKTQHWMSVKRSTIFYAFSNWSKNSLFHKHIIRARHPYVPSLTISDWTGFRFSMAQTTLDPLGFCCSRSSVSIWRCHSVIQLLARSLSVHIYGKRVRFISVGKKLNELWNFCRRYGTKKIRFYINITITQYSSAAVIRIHWDYI